MTTVQKVVLTVCWLLVVAAVGGMALTMNVAWFALAFVAALIRYCSKRRVPEMSKKENGILLALAIARQGPNWAP